MGEDCQGLKCISLATGGNCYYPKDLKEAFKLFESETLLSASMRETT